MNEKTFNLRDIKIIHLDPQRIAEPEWQLLLSADPSRDMVEAYLSEEYSRIAYHSTRPVAVYAMTRVNATCFEINNLAVLGSYQGIGLGRRMLGHALGLAESRGAREVLISTANSSLRNLRFYQQVGFRMIAVEPDYFPRHYSETIVEDGIPCLDRILMKMTLEPE